MKTIDIYIVIKYMLVFLLNKSIKKCKSKIFE